MCYELPADRVLPLRRPRRAAIRWLAQLTLGACLLTPLDLTHTAAAQAPPDDAPPAPVPQTFDPAQLTARTVYEAADSLNVGDEPDADARAMLDELTWEPGTFKVAVRPAKRDRDALVRFASPYPSGNKIIDRVIMEWYVARDAKGRFIRAPAVVVLHILDGRMVVARAIARGLSRNGVHAFVMHMPGYGLRRPPRYRHDANSFLTRTRQAATDARRARDAIAALPGVIPDRIGLQGTSLGGFVASVAGAIDGCFQPVFIALAGADLDKILERGDNEAKAILAYLRAAGFSDEQITAMMHAIEPSRIAHRLPAEHTWLFSAQMDQVVPPPNARALARAADLDESHHLWMSGDHYTCAIHLPRILQYMLIKLKPQPATP